MINVGIGPGIILGFLVSLASISLYILRILKPTISKDQDILFMTIGLIYSSILIVHGWRLDPILIFSQILLVGISIFFGYENLTLRNLQAQKNPSKFLNKKILKRKTVEENKTDNFLIKENKINKKQTNLGISNVKKKISENIRNKHNFPNLLLEYKEFEENKNIND
uniref:Ycf66 n=1 Tax=Sciadococcus taiwanensis TaxID=3028030 RepID=A0A9Y1I287_9RHOD|nr:hypothetical protein Ycf66 [Sciadococcus taiwanensis]